VLTALVTAVVSVAATLAATGAFTPTPTLDAGVVSQDVAKILSTSFGLSDVDAVTCPGAVEAREGVEFECTFVSGGSPASVPVLVLNDSGQYRVGGPTDG